MASEIEPEERIDYFVDKLRRYTVMVTIDVEGLEENDDQVSIRSRAIDGFRSGKLDGDAEIVSSEKIKEVKLLEDGSPFDLAEWQKTKCAERGLNTKGEPLKPHEKERPKAEQKLFQGCRSRLVGGICHQSTTTEPKNVGRGHQT